MNSPPGIQRRDGDEGKFLGRQCCDACQGLMVWTEGHGKWPDFQPSSGGCRTGRILKVHKFRLLVFIGGSFQKQQTADESLWRWLWVCPFRRGASRMLRIHTRRKATGHGKFASVPCALLWSRKRARTRCGPVSPLLT